MVRRCQTIEIAANIKIIEQIAYSNGVNELADLGLAKFSTNYSRHPRKDKRLSIIIEIS